MAIPDYQTLMLPVLKLARADQQKVAFVAAKIADDFGLTEAERDELLASGRQRILHNRVHWAKFYLTKAGLLTSPSHGQFVATDSGRQFLSTNPEKIDLQGLLKIPAFKAFYKSQEKASSPDKDVAEILTTPNSSTPEEQIETAYSTALSVLRTELIERIIQNSPSFFEQLIIDLLVSMGYGGSHKNAAAQLGRSGDGGVDGIINEDRLGLDRVYIQAKRYAQGTVGRPDVQAFVGSLVGLGATKGVFVTTSTFSAQARDFVKHLSQRVILIDGQSLADLMIEHDVGVRTQRTLAFKRLDEDFFSEDD